jgi:histidinol-phosphate aminotransferase
MSLVANLARPEILALKAYESARSLISSGEASVYLDANESPYNEGGLNRYPEPQPKELVARFCELYGVDAGNLVIGRGSDEAIDLLVRAFCRPSQDSILICPPTYGVYEISAQIQGAQVVRVPLSFGRADPELDEAGIHTALARGSVKIVFLCSPNNPTGTALDPLALSRICEMAQGRALVVVDEAYAEFSRRESMIGRMARFENLVILRTLSKAWGLAAVRCGVAIGSPELISLLHKVRAPYPLPLPAVQAALAATGPQARAELKTRLQAMQESKRALISRLRELPQVREILDSDANFLLVRFDDAAQIMKAARDAGIILRDRSREPGLQNCVRITLGTPAENQSVLEALAP